MKLHDFLNEMDRNTLLIMDMVEDYLRTHNFKLKVARAIEGLEDDEMEKLKGILFKEAEDNYDYGTDTGPSISIDERSIVAALTKMGVL